MSARAGGGRVGRAKRCVRGDRGLLDRAARPGGGQCVVGARYVEARRAELAGVALIGWGRESTVTHNAMLNLGHARAGGLGAVSCDSDNAPDRRGPRKDVALAGYSQNFASWA